MRGVVEPRGDNKWRVRVFAGHEGGKVRWVLRGRSMAPSARRRSRLAKLLTEVEAGQATKSHPTSVAEQLDRWLADIEPTRSAYTVKEHRRCIEHDIKPALGTVRLDKLTARQLAGFYHDLLARGLSPSSVRRFHSVLHAALDRAVKWGMVPVNPADRATPPGLTRTTVSAPDVADVQRLIAAADESSPILALAIILGAVTGARRGELCALRWAASTGRGECSRSPAASLRSMASPVRGPRKATSGETSPSTMRCWPS